MAAALWLAVLEVHGERGARGSVSGSPVQLDASGAELRRRAEPNRAPALLRDGWISGRHVEPAHGTPRVPNRPERKPRPGRRARLCPEAAVVRLQLHPGPRPPAGDERI